MRVVAMLSFIPLLASAEATPAQFVFVSPPQTIGVDTVSEEITLQAQNDAGVEWKKGEQPKLPSTACISLSVSPTGGEFSSSVSNWNAVSILSMGTNTANRSFYYKSNTGGVKTISATIALKPGEENRSCSKWMLDESPTGWTATHDIAVGSETGEFAQNPLPQPPSFIKGGGSEAGGGFSEPAATLSVTATVPARAIVGADSEFSAAVFGAQKEPISNARIIWNFGNGASREGASVRYAYNIPGTYLVVVSAASGGLSGMARIKITASAPAVRVSGLESGPAGFIEIENTGAMELDLSGWILASGSLQFALPSHTTLLPKTKVAFPASATGVFVTGGDARLLFPNGKEAGRYEEPEPPPPFSSEIPKKNPPSTPSFIKEGGTEGGGFSTTTPAAIAMSISDNARTPLWYWIGGVLGVGAVGVGTLAAFRFRPSTKDERSDAAQFAEKVHLV